MSKEYFEMQILCSLLLMPPKRSPDISKSSRYPWSIPVLQMRTPSGGTSALARLFYVRFCGSPWPCHGSGSWFPAQSDQASSKPHSTGDLAQASHTQSIPTGFLPPMLLPIFSFIGVLGGSRPQELRVPRPVIKLSLPLSHILIITAGGHANNINAAE